MRSKSLRSLVMSSVVALVAIALTTSCQTKKPKTEEAPMAAAGADGGTPTPSVSDQPITMDPMGSDSGKIAGLNTVYFEYDQARLTADSRKKLSENADWIKKHPNFTIQVEGHTDSRGSVEYNLALGERRAKSVKSYLESLGIEAKRLTIISYGKEKPIDSGDGESAWGKNRRANFVPLQ